MTDNIVGLLILLVWGGYWGIQIPSQQEACSGAQMPWQTRNIVFFGVPFAKSTQLRTIANRNAAPATENKHRFLFLFCRSFVLGRGRGEGQVAGEGADFSL